jgi:heme exporter protein B
LRVPPDLLRASALVARKDLMIEYRTRTAFFAAAAFALLAIVIFFFAWDPTAVSAIDLAPGVLWVIFTFSGLLGLQRSFGVEHADGAMDALLAAPIPREAIYIGKASANLVFVLAVQALAIPAVALFYNAPLGRIAWGLAAIAVLAAVGLVAVGTLFSAIAANTRLAELLLPVVVLPFFVPIVMAAAQATGQLMAGRPFAETAGWLQLLAAYDLVFAAACMLAFPYVLEE